MEEAAEGAEAWEEAEAEGPEASAGAAAEAAEEEAGVAAGAGAGAGARPAEAVARPAPATGSSTAKAQVTAACAARASGGEACAQVSGRSVPASASAAEAWPRPGIGDTAGGRTAVVGGGGSGPDAAVFDPLACAVPTGMVTIVTRPVPEPGRPAWTWLERLVFVVRVPGTEGELLPPPRFASGDTGAGAGAVVEGT